MTAYTGYVDSAGTFPLAHHNMLALIKTAAEAEGWTTLRYDTSLAIRELILHSTGFSGTEDIFIGFRTYHDTSADYYNLSVAGFTGYVPGNAFTAQPGYFESGIPAHNNRIDYWMAVNVQRIVFGLKVGTPVYEHGYAGKFFPYARPSQFPYPLFVGGMLTGIATTRYSDTTQSIPYKGSNARAQFRNTAGTWSQPTMWPTSDNRIAGATFQLRDTNGNYPLVPFIVMDASNVYGELDGVFYISGFNNAVENTLNISGDDYVVLQDVYRTGFTDYIALKVE